MAITRFFAESAIRYPSKQGCDVDVQELELGSINIGREREGKGNTLMISAMYIMQSTFIIIFYGIRRRNVIFTVSFLLSFAHRVSVSGGRKIRTSKRHLNVVLASGVRKEGSLTTFVVGDKF